MNRHFVNFADFDSNAVNFVTGVDRNGKTTIAMTHGPMRAEVAMISAPAITLWPRCSGDGNFGTMWGPTDITKSKFTLDLCDAQFNNETNGAFIEFAAVIEKIDDALLDFVQKNQLKILGRKNLSVEEVKMLQIRSVRPKYDKMLGTLTGHTMNLSTSKYAWDGMGGKYERAVTVCDSHGAKIPHGVVCPGDVVSATLYANMVYTGVGGDKFGIHWGFQEVAVICQRSKLMGSSEVTAFQNCDWPMAQPYTSTEEVSEIRGTTYNATDQFGVEAN